MSSKPTELASGLTSALTGMSLALGIAREATDAVPIVKQCLGSAVRILAFAEKMDKDRQALRELADKSLQLAGRVKDVMDGRTPDAKVETSLERILKVLESIETFMRKHSARSRLCRLIDYAFTVSQHVERLSRELADAVQELLVVVMLDVDHHVHATHTAVDENARFVGEFRLLRHCEVQKLDRIFDCENREDENEVVRYHRVNIDGQLLVVRYFEGSTPQHWPSGQEHDETMFHRIAVQDRILEEISTVQKSHPNVARIYGWSRGSARERFTVFKSGYQPVASLLGKFPYPIVTGLHWALKLLVEMNHSCSCSPLTQDAVHHLQLMGILWSPTKPPYAVALDDQLQPIIGLQNDLDRTDQHVDHVAFAYGQLVYMTLPLGWFAEWQSVPAAKMQKLLAGCRDERLADLLCRMEPIHRKRCIVPKEEFSHRRILSDTAAKSLLRIVEHELSDHWWPSERWMWANILLALDKNRSHPLLRGLRVVYAAHTRGGMGDQICLYGMDEDPECIVHDIYTFYVPAERKDELREMFGISALSEERWTSRLIATGTYRML